MTMWVSKHSGLRHPWLELSLKRKHSPPSTPDAEATKRRRSNTLERGFASLTLTTEPVLASPPVDNHPSVLLNPVCHDPDFHSPGLMAVDSQVAFPSHSPVTDFKMKSSSWYEPEKDRIVVVDLNDSEDEENESPETGVSISPFVLEHLKGTLYVPHIPVPDSSKALVLFRPLTMGSTPVAEDDEKDDSHQNYGDSDDAMDIEP